MTALILHDREAEIALRLLVNAAEILQAVAKIGIGIEKLGRRAAETDGARRGELDLHQTVIARVHDPRIIVAFDANDGIGERRRQGVVARMLLDPWAKLTLASACASAPCGHVEHSRPLRRAPRVRPRSPLEGAPSSAHPESSAREKSKRGQPQEWHRHELAFAGWERKRSCVFKIDRGRYGQNEAISRLARGTRTGSSRVKPDVQWRWLADALAPSMKCRYVGQHSESFKGVRDEEGHDGCGAGARAGWLATRLRNVPSAEDCSVQAQAR